MIRQGYKEYPLVVTDYHLICCFSFARKKVLNIDRISWFKIKAQRLLLVHQGWPFLVYVYGLTKSQQEELERLLEEALSKSR